MNVGAIGRMFFAAGLTVLWVGQRASAETASALQSMIGAYAQEHDFSGTILVEEDGCVLYRGGFGLADCAFHVPVADDTRYKIAIVAGWKNRAVATPAFSRQFLAPEPGVYFIQMPISQGYISLGHLGLEDTNPDYFAVQVMNFILGGSSFSSRITSIHPSGPGLFPFFQGEVVISVAMAHFLRLFSRHDERMASRNRPTLRIKSSLPEKPGGKPARTGESGRENVNKR